MAKSKKRPIPASLSAPEFSVVIDSGGKKVTVYRETTLKYARKFKDSTVVEVVNIEYGQPGKDPVRTFVNIDECGDE